MFQVCRGFFDKFTRPRGATNIQIAFDLSQTGRRKAGCGYYASSLLEGLRANQAKFHFLCLGSFGDFVLDPSLALRIPGFLSQEHWGPRHLTMSQARKFWNNKAKVTRLFRHTDIVHSNNFWCPPWKLSQPLVYTIYDMSFLENPEWHKEANRLICFEGVQRASIYADWFVSISQSSRQSFLNFFPYVDPQKVKVIYPGSRFHLRKKPGLLKPPSRVNFLYRLPFFLCTGTIEPRKNQQMLLNAYELFRDQGGETIPLVFAGGMGWLMPEFKYRIEHSKWSDDIYWLGYVSDDELQWLFSHCLVNLYPSFYEGFGLPVLEGMSLGAATFASTSTSLPEIVQDSGVLISPNSPVLWAQKLYQISSDPNYSRALSASALDRSASFSWVNSVSILQNLYLEAFNTDFCK